MAWRARVTHVRPIMVVAILLVIAAFSASFSAVRAAEATSNSQSKPVGGGKTEIAAVVNDDIITEYDIESQVNFNVAMSGKALTAEMRQQIMPQVLQEMIYQVLQLQAMRRYNISIGDEELLNTVKLIEKQSNISEGTIFKTMEKNKIPYSVYLDRVRIQLGWNELVRALNPGEPPISSAEVESVFQQIKDAYGKPESLVAEIVIPNSFSSSKQQVLERANFVLNKVKNGEDFAKIARQYSESISAASNGVIGWVQNKQLAPKLNMAIANLAIGEISPLIETNTGYIIYKVLERRAAMIADPDSRDVTLQRILFKPQTKAASSENKAEAVETSDLIEKLTAEPITKQSCDDFTTRAMRLGASNGGRETLKLKDLSAIEKIAIETLDQGQFSKPIKGAVGQTIIMVCQWQGGGTMPTQEQVRNSLISQRFTRLASRLIFDLQNKAFIDIRLK